jgi:hypothetical protein
VIRGQVYYNDTQREIKTQLGWEHEFYDFSYRRGNYFAAYKGTVINGANNGYLAFLVHQLDSIAVAEDQRKGVQFFLLFFSGLWRTFIYKIVAAEYSTPERFSKLKVVVANDGVYLRDESQKESVYSHPIGLRDLYSVNKLRFSDGALISVYDDWQNEIAGLVKEELIRKNTLRK